MIIEHYLLNKLHNTPGFTDKFDHFQASSNEVILFGSYAMECDTAGSDIDMLFVCNEKNYKDEYLDFMCVSEERLHLKSWLGSELANHIAKYGIWLKGSGNWKTSVFISKSSVDRKKIKILTRLSHLWVKQVNADRSLLISLFEDIILDSYRLILLEDGRAIPASAIVRTMFLGDKQNIFVRLAEDRYLGSIWREYISNLFPNIELEDLDKEIRLSLVK